MRYGRENNNKKFIYGLRDIFVQGREYNNLYMYSHVI